MKKGPKARIVAMGTYVPQKILNNKDFEKMVELSDEWIVSRTGIQERRIAAADEFASDMGAAAARNALESSGIPADSIDLILAATMTPDYVSSSTAALIQTQLGITQTPAFDLQAACSGYLYALSVAKAYVESGMYKKVLVVATEKMSAYVDYTDRSTCILFGDGASAAVIADEGNGLHIGAVCLGADGNLAELINVPAGGTRHPATLETVQARMHYFRMQGKEVFKHAVRRMSSSAKECLEKSGLREDQLSWVVPHQANLRIIDAIAKGFDLPDERMYKTVHKYGNTSASSVAIALQELVKEHSLKEGEHILLVAFGAGLTWGAAILTQTGT